MDSSIPKIVGKRHKEPDPELIKSAVLDFVFWQSEEDDDEVTA